MEARVTITYLYMTACDIHTYTVYISVKAKVKNPLYNDTSDQGAVDRYISLNSS